MERVSKPTSSLIKVYAQLTKPGILFGNSITAIGAFVLASQGFFNPLLFVNMLLGLALVMGSGCVFNNCIDRDFDAKMNRTRNRALVQGLLSIKQAFIYATVLLLTGAALLYYFVNPLSMICALFGFFVYVFFYSYSKHYSSHATLIGSFAGAIPPVVGYCAVTRQFDLGALLLFTTVAFWQMPHFYAIAIYRLEEYRSASLPVLPLQKGLLRTKIEMVLYILAFLVSASALTLTHYTGAFFLIMMNLLGWLWLGISFRGFNCKNEKKWGRKMFLYSLTVIMGFSFTLPFGA